MSNREKRSDPETKVLYLLVARRAEDRVATPGVGGDDVTAPRDEQV